MATEWFADWFDSAYYHLLYQNRDEEEAKAFINRLVEYLDLEKNDRVLDLPCGKGRHAVHLNALGFETVGADLAPQSIEKAQVYANEHLSFAVHDMRKPLEKDGFDAVFNLFTSFGYFEDDQDNFRAIDAMATNLKDGGVFVMDFMNVPKVVANLVPEEEKTVGDVTFKLKRQVIDGFIVKDIAFEDKGKSYRFQERVQAFSMDDFKGYFEHAGLKLRKVFGNYALNDYDEQSSDRMIFVLDK